MPWHEPGSLGWGREDLEGIVSNRPSHCAVQRLACSYFATKSMLTGIQPKY